MLLASDAHDAEQISSNGADDSLPTSRLALLTFAICVTTVVVVFDSTLITTLGPRIAESYDALSLLPEFTTAFFLAVVISQPFTGKLLDIYGRYASFMLALLVSLSRLVAAWLEHSGQHSTVAASTSYQLISCFCDSTSRLLACRVFRKESIVPVTLLTKRRVICSYLANWLTTMDRMVPLF